LKFTRTYNSKNSTSDILGLGWTFDFSSKIEINPLDSNDVYVYLPNGSINTFTKQRDWTYIAIYVLTTKNKISFVYYINEIKKINQLVIR